MAVNVDGGTPAASSQCRSMPVRRRGGHGGRRGLMHLLSAQAVSIQQDGEAIDLGQSPAPLIFASAADSELALRAELASR